MREPLPARPREPGPHPRDHRAPSDRPEGVLRLRRRRGAPPGQPGRPGHLRRERSQTRIRALTTEQLARLLQAADAHSPRTAALAWLLATTGLRISEACAAQLEDLQHAHDGAWLEVTCKGRLRRSVPLLTPTLDRVATLTSGRHSGPIFTTRTSAPLDRHAAARTLHVLATREGLQPFSPHVLRHTFVTLARAHGCALEDVQDAAGHADPATTRRYDRTVASTETHPGLPLIATLAQHGLT